MKKILIALLALTMCLSFCACGKQDSKPADSAFFSLEEAVNDPEFQQIFADEEDEVFTYAVSASDDSTVVFEAIAKKTYEEDELDFFRNLATEEISDKFALDDLQKMLKRYGFGDVTVDCKIINGDGTLITERTLD